MMAPTHALWACVSGGALTLLSDVVDGTRRYGKLAEPLGRSVGISQVCPSRPAKNDVLCWPDLSTQVGWLAGMGRGAVSD